MRRTIGGEDSMVSIFEDYTVVVLPGQEKSTPNK